MDIHKRIFQSTRGNCLLLMRSLKDVVAISPKICTLLALIIIISGIIPSIFIKLTANIIELIANEAATSSAAIYQNFSMFVAAMLIQHLAAPVLLYLQSALADKVTFQTNANLIEKANSFDTIEEFDKKDFHDRLELIKTQASHKPLNMIVTMVGLLKEITTMISCTILVFQILEWSTFLMVFCALTNAIIFVKIQNLMWHDSLNRSSRSRFLNYISSLSVNAKFVKEIRFFGYAAHIAKLYKKHSRSLLDSSNNARAKAVIRIIPATLLTSAVTALLIYNITHKVSQGALGIGAIAVLVHSILLLQAAANNLGEQAGWMSGHLLFFKKYYEFLDIKIYHQEYKPFDEIIRNITFQQVNFAYGNSTALQDCSFEIRKRETVAVVGTNGAGKSTLIKLICGLYSPQKGQILINNSALSSIDPSQWRSKISPVFQDFCTYELTLRENLACQDQLDLERMNRALSNASVSNLSACLDNPIGRSFGGRELSIGQWQKIALARALYNKHEVLILDEPTASLDPISEHEFYEKFSKLAADKIVVLVTHRLSAVNVADKILFIDQGKVIDFGTHLELYNRCKKYKQMLDKQTHRYLNLSHTNAA